MTAPTRTTRIAGGVALSLLHQAIAVLVGLWLTRFLLENLGERPYGLWIVALQLAAWLALADLGVVGILPRQTAFASGDPDPRSAIPGVAGETARLVLWQWPLVALVAVGIWLLLPDRWGELHGPLTLVLAGFVATFPLRIFPALLQGLQDLAFAGWVGIAGWAINTIAVVALVLQGAGLYALAIAWTLTQLLPPLACWHRLRTHHPHVLPAALPSIGWKGAGEHLSRSIWVSVSQLSGALGSGADVLIIGMLLGPAAVVPYVITGKLLQVAGGLPSMLAHNAGPALSQLRVAEGPARLRHATGALSQAVLVASGAIGTVALAANAGFVGWWVGPERFGGLTLTALFVAVQLVRHYGATLVYTVFAFGHERAIALAGLAEGAVAVLVSMALVRHVGVSGALIGQLTAALFVTIPILVPLLARAIDASVSEVLGAIVPWLLRAALPLAGAGALALWWRPATLPLAVAGAVLAGAAYLVMMLPFLRREPLAGYIRQLVPRW